MAGTWTPLANRPPFFATTMYLLTDGTILCMDREAPNRSPYGKKCWKLTPDAYGSYVNGTWQELQPMINSRLYYGAAVLPDGRVVVVGGEYSDIGFEINKGEIYDPVANSWTAIADVPGSLRAGDAASCLLPDGRLLLGSNINRNSAIYDPSTDTWSLAGLQNGVSTKDDSSSEESWVLLPDNSVLVVECSNSPKAERYLIDQDLWTSAGVLPYEVVHRPSLEIGAGVLLYDGRVIWFGGNGRCMLYNNGAWEAAPDFPSDGRGGRMAANDAPACLMPNGKVLATANPGSGNGFQTPTFFYEWDGDFTSIPAPFTNNSPAYVGRMLLVPTGEVLYAAETRDIYVYTPDGDPDPSWRPVIVECPTDLVAGGTYTLYGRQLNGLSQANMYGDDSAAATNYPLVAIRNLDSSHVRYCNTVNHSTMGVATGDAIVSTDFTVPDDIEDGPSELFVIVNGIASEPCPI